MEPRIRPLPFLPNFCRPRACPRLALADMQALNELQLLRVEDDELRASIEYTKGVTLAVSSGLFIGASFIIKKKGLLAAGQSGLRAAAGGFSYLREPLWWLGMVTMIGGECANFAAYAYAPAIVVTPLGATTIVSSAIFANCFLGETLHACGAVGCALCVLGSIILVSFAPEEAQLQSVEEIWVRCANPNQALRAPSAIHRMWGGEAYLPARSPEPRPALHW